LAIQQLKRLEEVEICVSLTKVYGNIDRHHIEDGFDLLIKNDVNFTLFEHLNVLQYQIAYCCFYQQSNFTRVVNIPFVATIGDLGFKLEFFYIL
jgi:hypothetical protein